MANNAKNKVISIVLCLVMILLPLMQSSMIAFAEDSTSNATITISPSENVVVSDIENAVLTAEANGNGDLQWQIYSAEHDMWINIYGETGEECTLTYAKIYNMLDEDDTTKVRCVLNTDSGAVASEAVKVTAEEVGEMPAMATFNLRTAADETVEAAAADEPAVADAGEDAKTTYNVVVNYVFENDEIVADPYTANLAAGSNFSATVNFPVVQGYLAYLDDATEATTGYDLNIVNIQGDVTHTVTYKPTNVDYTVIHYQQNLDNDNYTEVERETLQGLTKSTVPEVANEYAGFYALLYEKPAIAADGSTVVEVYYDRYYYLMNFNLDGGYGVEPIYARYGAAIEDIGTPIKAGYTFKGWTLNDEAATVPSTMPAENRTYIAVWEADPTAKVTIVFWGENADDEEYSYIKSAEVNVKPGTEFTYSDDGSLICGVTDAELHTHSEDCGYACGKETHSHDRDCYSLTCGKAVHQHSDACYTCGAESHTHGTGCYDGVGEATSHVAAPSDAVNGQIYTWSIYIASGKSIYINGTWYKYTGSINTNGQIAPTICGKTEQTHTHTDACLGCGVEAHTHSDITGECYALVCTTEVHSHSDDCGYNCGKTAHSHTSACYMAGAGLDSDKWTFVRSETVTVAADGSTVVNVYYDRVSYNVEFHRNQSCTNEYTDLRITAKWGENILDKWPSYNGSSSWLVEDKSDTWQNSIQIMPVGGAKFWGPKTGNSSYTASYYVEVLPGESGTTHNGVTYKLHHQDVSSSSGSVTAEERYEIKGFTYKEGTADGQSFSGAKFYYTRNSYNLIFSDGFDDVKTESVKYEAPLSTYKDFVPDVPSAYEPGSVEFAGWYLNPECTGAEYDLTKHNMPADNVLLYAKWVPVDRTVEFYLDKDALDAGTKLESHPDVTVPHGETVDPTPVTPENGDYIFVGWFYLDEEGNEKAFDFANMPVRKDMQVYGKWSSNVLKQYFIYYKIQGTDTDVAEPTTGSALAGITKTFDAKGGTDLYADYQEGYFPVVKSHSLTVDIENDENNVYIFEYVQKDAVPYTVKYLNAETGEPVADEKVVSDNRKAVVTETFVPVSGMLPDAYQKRLIVDGTDGAVNEIIFYYTEDKEHAYYKITHYTENLDGETWTEYASSQAVGNIGQMYTAEPITINGFTYNSSVDGTVDSGELTANGLELKLYYTRNEYPYQVRYLENGTGKELEPPKDGSGKYGQVISESAIDIDSYKALAPTSQTLNIRIEESNTAKLNIITFYYEENEVTINYEVVGPDGCGTVDPTSESVKVLTGKANGSTAAASENYHFVGWYDNAGCDGTAISTDAKFVPTKAEDAKWIHGTTYYAKFEENEVTINYVAVGPEGATNFGNVDPTSEPVKVLTGKANGSTASAGENYHFVGWYDNAECTGTAISTDAKFVPTKAEDAKWIDGTTYYAKFEESEVTINYVAVGPGGATEFGVVNPESESVKVLTGTAIGSEATAAKNFRFVGWYDNAKCEGEALSTEAAFVPTKPGDVWEAATYYAKFEYDVQDLTITKKVELNDDEVIDADQTFIFNIVGIDGRAKAEKINMTVTIKGEDIINGDGTASVTIKDLPLGTYEVIEDSSWSWRFDSTSNPENGEITLNPGKDAGGITISNAYNEKKDTWLNDVTNAVNKFNPVAE